ncbi:MULTISPECIES: AraC family transcriptional regulator [Dyella]|uniref:AraC family transcriptional regulator n=2 Tax=Dyella TaxID=231454 RepID=A0A4R0YXK8_9GAMM|nr:MULTISPECIES: AraC family transcriptional regulator [Dyella]TBR39079.1 AraC family transcriptional regulator [Dyella terrae]TCI13331.1 AraC family transcriptional regulator [Dyella soli]
MNAKLSEVSAVSRLQQDREELTALVERFAPAEGTHPTAWAPLTLFRANSNSVPTCALYEPSLGLALQGRKQILVGKESMAHGPATYLLTSVDVPVTAQVSYATPEEPCLCLNFRFDLQRIRELLHDVPVEPAPVGPARGIALSPMDAGLIDPLLRLVRLLATPEDLPILGPLIERELFYRLLTGAQGARLAQIATAGTQGSQIARAIQWLRECYAQPLRIDDLAGMVNMSASSLHHHFRAMTAMSPLQYQKSLRLQEARRLLLAERCDVATAAHRVGYESPSQFSREYSRQFGSPPVRDVGRLRVAG